MVALGGLVEVTVQDLAERWTSLLISSTVSAGLPAPVGLAERGYRSVSIGGVKATGGKRSAIIRPSSTDEVR
jgi:hypothetical protein